MKKRIRCGLWEFDEDEHLNLRWYHIGIPLFIIFIITLFSTIANAEDKWTKTNISLEIAYQGLHLIDFSQTLQIVDNPDRYWERNPLLGEHSSRERVCLYFMGVAFGHLLISHFLKEPYRTAWQSMTIVIVLPVIAGNFNIGLGFKF